ncbi:MAG TPA: hypothetical protein VMF62_13440 [Acetobacteraceae bacterium]|nr:hypothetical protein [Acetobacteraceae bacterium]
MDDLTTIFSTTMARTALADIEGTFDRAAKRSGLTGRQIGALVKLRERSVAALDRIAKGRDPRLPAAVLDEALEGIGRILSGDAKQAIAKAASGPGHRDTTGLHNDGKIPASITGEKLEGEALVRACIAIAKEFRELAEQARKACKKLNAEAEFDRWEKRYHRRLFEALHKKDLWLAQFEMAEARSALSGLLDHARIDHVLGEVELPPERPRTHGGKK